MPARSTARIPVKRETPDAIAVGDPETPWAPSWTTDRVIRALEPLVLEARRERLRSVLSQRLDDVTVLMDAPHDPHNGAAILRSCDAFGLQTVHVLPREEEFLASRTVAKGSERWVDVVTHRSVAEAVSALGSAGYRLVATHPEGSLTPTDLGRIPRMALVLGNEHDGIRRELASAAQDAVRIPMRGFVESLNVSVAAGILLEAATRGRRGNLDAEHLERLYARGLYRTVPRAEEVLAALDPA
jgi:tRNA (guanosine-2'-O-)-methyltransferase